MLSHNSEFQVLHSEHDHDHDHKAEYGIPKSVKAEIHNSLHIKFMGEYKLPAKLISLRNVFQWDKYQSFAYVASAIEYVV
ncbi:hypothetical protein BLOT_010177 [Blomia tropicalis]|nr:hypothetical protein BLOT_010177 [Blomia tropicalis]